tara:strand:- start:2398 stop:2628 length:231 start_codon:yes stop_codon:yes gene_type:complete
MGQLFADQNLIVLADVIFVNGVIPLSGFGCTAINGTEAPPYTGAHAGPPGVGEFVGAAEGFQFSERAPANFMRAKQ